MAAAPRRLLLTGATGFVGRAVAPALQAAGWTVRGLSRNGARAAIRHPELEWVDGDVADEKALRKAFEGCEAALYLVHSVGIGPDYHQRELDSARHFAKAAAEAGVKRIVYLGGVAPQGKGSEHLRSRLDVGALLRRGPVPAVELRASMIVGHGSLSWLMVRDLAARLPAMVLPAWLHSRTEPVAIDDVVAALVGALELKEVPPGGASYDLPGPEILSGTEILTEAARAMGLSRPVTVEVPLVTPRLSSFWVRFVTRADWKVARQLVMGLTEDLLARDDHYWTLIGHPQRQRFADAAHAALAREEREGPIPGLWGAVERAIRARA